MATLLIDKFIEANLTITNNGNCDFFLILPEAVGITTAGQIISADGIHSMSYDEILESYCLSVKGSSGTGKLAIGGNYNAHRNPVGIEVGSNDPGTPTTEDFAATINKDMTNTYNLYHLQFNNNAVSGAVKFYGTNNQLILTAQNGAAYANEYHTAGEGFYKTDDNIRIAASAYGFYDVANYGDKNAPSSAPYTNTVAYTIHATNKLTVVSDLAGIIETDVAAFHFGYYIQKAGQDKPTYQNDSTGNTVEAAGIKANELFLEGNFRAELTARNNSAVFSGARSNTSGFSPDARGYSFSGTTIGGYNTPIANNNTIASYGIWVDSNLTMAENTIWAGTITVDTSDVSIVASASHLRPKSSPDDTLATQSATANGNIIAAYGIKSEGSLTIAEMGTLKNDKISATDNPDDVTASINVSLNDNTVLVEARATDAAMSNASASSNTEMIAAGISAQTVTLGNVSSGVWINVEAIDNYFSVASTNAASLSGGLKAYGIQATTLNLAIFEGNIFIDAGRSILGASHELTGATTSLGFDGISACGINVSTLKSSANMGGTITVSADYAAMGIHATTITVNGVITTAMDVTANLGNQAIAFGIYTSTITASAFSGTIEGVDYGINARTLQSSVSNDKFDMNGDISAEEIGLVSSNALNMRVSGTIQADTAIITDCYLAPKGNQQVSEAKHDDNLELASTARIRGNIDLGAGLNVVTANSGARVEGSLFAEAGEINLFFILEGEAQNGAVFQTQEREYHEDDKSLKDSMTFTVNCNYAQSGELYKLFSYRFNAMEYWVNRQVAFSYQGHNVMVTLRDNGNNTLSGTFTTDDDVTFYAEYDNNIISVSVAGTGFREAAALEFEYAADAPADAPADEPAAPGEEETPATPVITEVYDAKAQTFTIAWKDIDPEAYDLHVNTIAAYEIEYWLDGAENSIVVRLDGSKSSFAIAGVANNSTLEYRMRLLGDNSANAVTAWSDVRTITGDEEAPISTFVSVGASDFTEEKMSTDVLDANPSRGASGLVASIAELNWSKMDSANPIRNYEIEYCALTEQITIEDVRDFINSLPEDQRPAGEITLVEFIEKYLFDDENNQLALESLAGIPYYTKLVTGTQVAISNFQNQTYVYWKIRAIDSTGEKSDWVAGETFRVWANDDQTAPVFSDTTKSAAAGYIFPAAGVTAPDAENAETLYSAVVGWDAASDSESGVRAYTITLTDSKGNKQTFEVNAESQEDHHFFAWKDTKKSLSQDSKYTIVANDVEIAAQLQIDSNGNVTLAWDTKDDSFLRLETVTVKEYLNGVEINSFNVSNFTAVTYDFSFKMEGLSKDSYTYYITATDYFGNEVAVKNAVQGSFSADITDPWFEKSDTVTRSEDFGILNAGGNDFSAPITLTGSLKWNAATDAESGVRSYVIKFSANGGKTIDREFTFAVNAPAEGRDPLDDETIYLEDSMQTQVTLTGLTAGAKYLCEGQQFVAKKDGTYVIYLDGNRLGGTLEYALVKDDGNITQPIVTIGAENAEICYSIDLDALQLTNPNYTYFIYAQDYMGNLSSNYLTGDLIISDKGAPSFLSDKGTVDLQYQIVNDGVRDVASIKPTITWTPAEDVQGDMGVRYYALYVREQGSSDWGEAVFTVAHSDKVNGYSWSPDEYLEMQVYEYKIVAYDYFGKTDTITGNFGMNDIIGPQGSFNTNGFRSNVDAQYVTRTETREVLDESGNPKKDSEGNVITETVILPSELTEASVTLSWQDNFTDDSGVIYKVTVSSDPNLAPDGNTYIFWTTEAGVKEMVFDETTTGRNVGIFESMKTVYWTVEAYDTQYNKSGSPLGVGTPFEFKNSYGEYIKLNTAFTAPTTVNVSTSEMLEGVHTGKVTLSWRDPDSALGVYKYTINLYDATGKKLIASGSSLDLDNQLGTDLTGNITVNGSTLTISDLRRFLGVISLEDGAYKVSVTAHDTSNRKAESQKVDFILDTTPPARVNVTSSFALPSNSGEDKFCDLMLTWNPVTDANGISHYVVEYKTESATSWHSAIAYGTEFTLKGVPASNTEAYEFRVYAVDGQSNQGIEWPTGEVVTVKPVFDRYNDSIQPGKATDVTNRFENNKQIIADTVGQGDTADTFVIKTGKSMSLNLTATALSAHVGANGSVTVNIYEGTNTSKVWKSYTVKAEGRVFSELLLNSNTSYTFQVVTPAKGSSVADYEFVLEKNELNSYNFDDTVANVVADAADEDSFSRLDIREGVIADPAKSSDWIGYGDAVDYKYLNFDASGKYTFTLSGVSVSTKLTVYEILDNGKLKSLGTVTANAANPAGVTTKEILLDRSGSYVLEVKVADTKALGSDYNLSVNCTESYAAASTGDDIRSIADNGTPELDFNNVNEGWVGYGDATDFYRLQVGADGGVYNFTVSHNLGSDEALKLTVYEALAFDEKGNAIKFRTVKSITLANTAAAVSTGNLFLTGDQEGIYFVEVTAPGAAKAQNSSYYITAEGYDILDDNKAMSATDPAQLDTANDDIEDVLAGEEAVTSGDGRIGWVGIGDAVDTYKVTITDGGSYTFSFGNINGKEFSAVLGYFDEVKGKEVKVAAFNGAANSDALLSTVNLEARDYYLQITAKGKNANTDYSFGLNETDSFFNEYDNETIYILEENAVQSVGGANPADTYVLSISDSGFYNLNVSGVVNPVKVTVYDAATNKSVGTISLTAAKNSGSISGMLLDSTKEYYAEVTATGAAKGQGSGYFIELESENNGALTAGAEAVTGVVGPSSKIDTYTLEVSDAGVYTFALSDVTAKALKFSVIDLATGKAVANFTPAAGSAAVSYEFGEGSYLVKLESTSKSKDANYTLELIDRNDDIALDDDYYAGADTSDLSTATPINGWVGKGDSADWALIDLSTSGTGIYDINVNVDNNAKVTVYSVIGGVAKAVKSVSATAAKGGALTGLLLDGAAEYYVAVQASNVSGTKDVNYTVELTQSCQSQTDDGAPVVITTASYENENGWVGFGDKTDNYLFTVGSDMDAVEIKVALGDLDGDVTVTLYNGDTKVKSFTVNAKNDSVSNTYLLEAGNYRIEVVSPKAEKGAVSEYTIGVEQWAFSNEFRTLNNTIKKASEFTVGGSAASALWKDGSTSEDSVDYYVVEVTEDGCYLINLDGISGNISLAIGTKDAKGNFKQLSGGKVTAKAGSDALAIGTELAAGTYYIKLESTAKNSATQYELTMENLSARAGFSNADDTVKLVAGDTEAVRYSEGEISNWVGYGDAVDLLKIRTDENGFFSFFGTDADTIDALSDKEITLTLMDVNGKSVALTFDAAEGSYISKNVLMADTDYYLQVKSANAKSGDNSYNITFSADL